MPDNWRRLLPQVAELYSDLKGVAAKKVVLDRSRAILARPGAAEIIDAYNTLLIEEPDYNVDVQEIADRVWFLPNGVQRTMLMRRMRDITGYNDWPSEDGSEGGDVST